jgi:recombinational DNA repair protein RecT
MRTDVQCLHRWNKVLKPGLHKGPWREDEDNIVKETVIKNGVGKVKWSAIAALVSCF